jgi:hypothetical protein
MTRQEIISEPIFVLVRYSAAMSVSQLHSVDGSVTDELKRTCMEAIVT